MDKFESGNLVGEMYGLSKKKNQWLNKAKDYECVWKGSFEKLYTVKDVYNNFEWKFSRLRGGVSQLWK